MLYVIQATITTTRDGWEGARALPTFYLDSTVQGITDSDHAARIGRDIVLSFTDADWRAGQSVSVNVTAVPVDGDSEPLHQPSGLPMILARHLPAELLELEGMADLLNLISGRYDSHDAYASAAEVGFAAAQALYALEMVGVGEVPEVLEFSPGAWNGQFTADDLRSGGPGGDYELTAELLECMDPDTETGVDQLTRLGMAASAIIDRLRAAGHGN